MELHAYTRTISDLFSVKKKYIVPRFQREYSWTKEQVKELWEDIISNITRTHGKFHHEEYFIGALVLVGNDKSSALQIVDGQQRLTTITILLSVLSDRFLELKKKNLAEAIYENYISGKDDDGNAYFKLENETPKPFFQTNIQHIEKANDKPQTEEEKTLVAAYKDLYNFSSRELLQNSFGFKKATDDEYLEILKALRDQVAQHLKVIFITVAEEEEAYTIFETLNARGMNLSFVDLIKNKLFKELKDTHPDDEAKTKWKNIRSTISSREGVGSLESFVRHWWLSKYAYVSGEKVYKSFKDLWKAQEIDAKSFINDLSEDANKYVIIATPQAEDFKLKEEKYIFHIFTAFRTFGITQQRPFLLSLLKAKEKKLIKAPDLKEILQLMESFHFKFNAICSQRPSGIEGSYSKAARDLISAKNRNEAKKIINTLKTRLIEREPEESVFIDKFNEIKFSDGNTRHKRLIQYILTKMENNLNHNNELVPEDITLEHVFPQSKGDNDFNSKIGNIIPLSAELNSKAGNKEVKVKVQNYYCKSNFKLTKEFVDSFNNTWSKKEIEERTNDLALRSYNEIWKLD